MLDEIFRSLAFRQRRLQVDSLDDSRYRRYLGTVIFVKFTSDREFRRDHLQSTSVRQILAVIPNKRSCDYTINFAFNWPNFFKLQRRSLRIIPNGNSRWNRSRDLSKGKNSRPNYVRDNRRDCSLIKTLE